MVRYNIQTTHMTNKDLEETLQNITLPDGDGIKNSTAFKMALLNTRRSSSIGFLFIILPCLFLAGVLITHILGFNFPLFNQVEEQMAAMDKKAGIKWITPFMLIGLPIIGIAANLLAIMHFTLDRIKNELIISIKYSLRNIMVLLISFIVIGIFALYIITDHT
jgi:hypothetical protein